MTCENANMLGIPGKGIHKFRLGGVAIIDLLFTLLLALILSYIPESPPITIWIIILLLLSIVIHGFFCTKTSGNEWLYKNNTRLVIIISCIIIFSILIIFFKNNY